MISSILLSALVVFGIGLVIFVHELGHYMAARWCGARVETFSLGFGPRIFGWQRGDTMFQVAAVPLGGYVKVAGEYFDGTSPEEPGTLSSLNVPQRFLYYSGGVIMNVVFALVVMPLVMFAGLPAIQPLIGTPTPGMPAWHAGVPAGSVVQAVNGQEITDFEHLFSAVAVNGKDIAELRVLAPGSDVPQTFTIQPDYDENLGLYRLGLPRGLDPNQKLIVREESPAAAAGLTSEDRLLAVVGQPETLGVDDQLRRAFTAEGTVVLRVVAPDETERTVTIEPKVTQSERKLIGVAPMVTRVAETRSTGAAQSVLAALDLRPGDVIVSVLGQRIGSFIDLRNALLDAAPATADVELLVDRNGQILQLSAPLGGVEPIAVADDIAFESREDTTYADVSEGDAAYRAGLRDGDRVVSVNGKVVEVWNDLLTEIKLAVAGNYKVELLAYRDPAPEIAMLGVDVPPTEELRLTMEPETQPVPDYGFTLSGATMVLRADSLGQAVTQGVAATKRFLVDVWMQLKKMLFSDEISTKNLGGIISISVISFDTASQGLPKLFFFLAILSINLAIINLLPIPILDGGHLLFLLIEGIKGSPVSERTFGYSQVVGLVMIMSLMVYVTYQDIVRWFLTSP